MAESTSGQGEVNPAFWLAICSGFSSLVPQEKVLLLAIILNTLLTKRVKSRWLDIDLVRFCVVIDLAFVSVDKT